MTTLSLAASPPTPGIFGGNPIVRGMRSPVGPVPSLPAAILEDYPGLEADDVRACLACAQARRRLDS